jgi:hypothetical protein
MDDRQYFNAVRLYAMNDAIVAFQDLSDRVSPRFSLILGNHVAQHRKPPKGLRFSRDPVNHAGRVLRRVLRNVIVNGA